MGDVSVWAVIIFLVIVGLVLFVSFYTARRARSASGYYAAGGRIHWGVNGIAFAGDYLSAASFLGICGLIATAGYDGFLYSIGYLAGWVVALFVVAEPMRRLGRYTFTDALDAKFNKRGLKLMAAIATLIVSIFYLIPQMVGAGVLIEPLLGFPYWAGVVIVGAIVITIVATAGMTSTTYVQFIKGALLIVFALVIVIALTVQRPLDRSRPGRRDPVPRVQEHHRHPGGRHRDAGRPELRQRRPARRQGQGQGHDLRQAGARRRCHLVESDHGRERRHAA